MNTRTVLGLCLTAALLGTGSSALYAQAPPRPDPREEQRRNQRQQEDVTALVQLVDKASAPDASGAPAERQGDVEINWTSNHFIKGQDGATYVPFTLTLDRTDLTSPNVAMYIRAVSTAAPAPAAAATPAPAPAPANGNNNQRNNNNQNRNNAPAAAAPRVTFPWDNAYFTTVPADGRLQRAMQLPGGEYDVFIAIKDQATGERNQVAKVGLLRKRLVVPSYKAGELATSSVMLGSVEPVTTPLSAAQQQENPYTFGTMRIVPVLDPKLSKSGELSVIFWIYGPSLDPATQKPNVTVEYNFHQKTGETEKFFNKTTPQELNAQTLPAEFNPATHQLPGSLGVPLASFPPGDYRLEIKVTDKVSNKSTTQNVNFTVNPA